MSPGPWKLDLPVNNLKSNLIGEFKSGRLNEKLAVEIWDLTRRLRTYLKAEENPALKKPGDKMADRRIFRKRIVTSSEQSGKQKMEFPYSPFPTTPCCSVLND